MRVKNGFILREVAGTFIVVSVGERVKEFNGVINLNETGATLWRALEKDVTEEDLVKVLLNAYDVDESLAREDVAAFVKKLKDAKLLKQ